MPLSTRDTSTVWAHSRGASSALRSQAVHLPRSIRARLKTDAVVQAILPAVPEFDLFGLNTISSPVLWTRHVAGRILRTDRGIALLQFRPRSQRRALRRDSGRQAAPW